MRVQIDTELTDANATEIFDKLRMLESVEMVDIISSAEKRFEVQSRSDMSSVRGIFKMCVANDWILTRLSPIETKLEDVFRELTLS